MEVLMSIMSWIRRFLIIPIWIAVIGLLLLGIFAAKEMGGDKILGMNPCIFASLLIFLITYLPSALFCLCGWGFRKIFKHYKFRVK
jgi:fumarate reductase subunit D